MYRSKTLRCLPQGGRLSLSGEDGLNGSNSWTGLQTSSRIRLFPLPPGEGRGEGN